MTDSAPDRRPWLELKTIVDQGVNVSHLATSSGYSRQQIHNLISGRSRPTPPAIRKLAAALGIQYSVLEPHDGAVTGPLGYSIDDTAEMLNVARADIEDLVTSKEIGFYLVGDQVRIRAEEIDRIVAGATGDAA